MCTWIFDPAARPGLLAPGRAHAAAGLAVAAAALVLLGACATPPERAVAVAGGAVTVAGPPGFCVDGAAVRDGPEGAFVLLASCAALGPASGVSSALAALLSASVLPGPAAPLERDRAAMERFFNAPAGRAMLAHDGRPESVEVLATEWREGVFLVRLSDASAPADLARESWRGMFTLNALPVSVALRPARSAALRPAAARTLLMAFVARIRAASAGPEVAPPLARPPALPAAR